MRERKKALEGEEIGFEHLENYESSDYDFIEREEQEYLDMYKAHNLNKFQKLKQQLLQTNARRGQVRKQATQLAKE